jgi:hypothetical protein
MQREEERQLRNFSTFKSSGFSAAMSSGPMMQLLTLLGRHSLGFWGFFLAAILLFCY